MLVFVPDGAEEGRAFERTTDLCIAAHQDDIEIMAFHAAAACMDTRGATKNGDLFIGDPSVRWFSGVTVTDGAGSQRAGVYQGLSDENIKRIRAKEQNMAARIAKYSVQIQLELLSRDVRENKGGVIVKIAQAIRECGPEIVYTHSLMDRHETHAAVALRTIAALRSLKPKERPQKLFGMEVRGSLDWLEAQDKIVFDASAHPNIAQAVLGVYESQMAGGKRYDQAVLGRRMANAVFLESQNTDKMEMAAFGMDMTQLMDEGSLINDYIENKIRAFELNTLDRINKLKG